MITDDNKWHFLAVSNLSALLAKKSSNHKGDLYCLECFNSYTTENRFKEHEEICNKHDSCRIVMLKWTERIIKYGHGEKPLRAPFAIYLDLECLLKKETRQNNPEKSCTDKMLRMSLLAGQCLQNVHLTKQKINSLLQTKGLYWKIV